MKTITIAVASVLAGWCSAPVLAQTGPGQALSFSGTASVAVPHHSALNAYPLTVTAWVKTSQNDGTIRGIVQKGSLPPTNGYAVSLQNGHVRAAYGRNLTSYVLDGTSPLDGGFIADGTWHHVAFVVNSSGGKLYVDGTQKMSRAWSGAAGACSPTAGLLIGRYGSATMSGTLDEITLRNTALSQAQILAGMHMAAGSGPLGYWALNEGAGTTAGNSGWGGSVHNGTLLDAPAWVTSGVPFAPDCGWADATSLSGTAAQFHVKVNPGNLPTEVWFIYGTNSAWAGPGWSSATTTMGAANEGVDVNITVSGLASGTTYFCRSMVSNAVGSRIGDEFSFTFQPRAATMAGIIGALSLLLEDTYSPSWTLTPFDADVEDLIGPSSWLGNYGKTPEIIVASNGRDLDVLAQDYDASTPWDALLLHVAANSSGYKVTQVLTDIPMLDRVMGLASDDSGNRYYATGVDESAVVNPDYPPLNTYRSNMVRVVKLNAAGVVQFNIDLDTARHAFDANAEMIINPMVAATARLTAGGNEIALVHGINTAPDWSISGRRHQKALSTRLNAANGAITRTHSVWVSHSFDQRLLYDGEGIIEHHLGDAYPRHIVMARNHVDYSLFYIKGSLGENNTYTRLGNIALIQNDPTFKYIAVFATENSATTGGQISGPRNLAMVRVKNSDNSLDPTLPDTLTISSAGTQYNNRLKWLTQHSAGSKVHAERPKLVGLGGDLYVVLWEEWLCADSSADAFNGVYAMVINDKGAVLQPAKLITSAHHLHRGDDAFLLDHRAAWMTGNATEHKLYIHFVDAALNYQRVPVE